MGLKIRRLLEAAPSLTLIMCTEPHMTDRGLKHNSNHVKSVRSVGHSLLGGQGESSNNILIYQFVNKNVQTTQNNEHFMADALSDGILNMSGFSIACC